MQLYKWIERGIELDNRVNNECSTSLFSDVELDDMEDVGYYSTGPYLMHSVIRCIKSLHTSKSVINGKLSSTCSIPASWLKTMAE